MERRSSSAVSVSIRVLGLSLAALVVLTASAQTNRPSDEATPALLSAVLSGDARAVQELLQHGADPNQPGRLGTTALRWAVPDLEKVRILLDHGADVNARSETERTALLVASSYPRTVELLKLLLEHGADLHAQDKAGANALSLAVRSADID